MVVSHSPSDARVKDRGHMLLITRFADDYKTRPTKEQSCEVRDFLYKRSGMDIFRIFCSVLVQRTGECIPPPNWKFLAPPNRKSVGQLGSQMIFCIKTMK